jgi:hypothetical protein
MSLGETNTRQQTGHSYKYTTVRGVCLTQTETTPIITACANIYQGTTAETIVTCSMVVFSLEHQARQQILGANFQQFQGLRR